MAQVQLWPLSLARIGVGGTPVTAIFGPVLGGFIVNPEKAADQTIAVSETLFIDLVHPAGLIESATTFKLQPGQSFPVPAGFTGQVSVNAATTGHSFAGLFFTEVRVPPPKPKPGDFPLTDANGNLIPTTLSKTIPSYLYQQYSDDDDLQAFVTSFNNLMQQYISWFAYIELPVYTADTITGSLLDWVAAGLYGIKRPALPAGRARTIGPLNTYALNTLALNVLRNIPPASYYATSDDIFKRIITWHFYKEDGKVFDIRWLKRRVERFLRYENGRSGAPIPYQPDQTYDVSVTFGANNEVNINLQTTKRRFVGGALLNTRPLNTFALNEFDTTSTNFPVNPLAPIFKAAMDAGVLEVPFQFKFIVNTN
jgi:hypothetical protein